jgi:hypothetical protein
MWHCVDIVLTDVSEEHISFSFRVEEKRGKFASEEPACEFSSFFFYPEDGGDTFL